MKPRHLVPFAILLFWQAAPLQVERAPSGHYRLSVGLGGGAYPQDYTDCNGATATTTSPFQSTGVLLDAWPTASIRVSAFGGQFGIGRNSKANRTVGGFQLAWEGRLAGLGLGLAGASGSGGRGGLSAYLRLGDADGLHVRADLRQPTTTWLTPGWARVGIGYNQGLRRGFGSFVGVSRVLGHAPLDGPPGDDVALFGDFTFRLGGALDLLARGHVGDGTGSMGFGVRYNFGPRRVIP
jgi:hypothetical protein